MHISHFFLLFSFYTRAAKTHRTLNYLGDYKLTPNCLVLIVHRLRETENTINL